MKKALLIVAIAALPLAAFGSQLVGATGTPESPVAPSAAGGAAVSQEPGQACCVVFIMGKYYCMPC